MGEELSMYGESICMCILYILYIYEYMNNISCKRIEKREVEDFFFF